MATTNNIVLKGNYNSAVVINKPLSANGESVTLSLNTNVVRAGSVASESSFSLGQSTTACGKNSIATGCGTKANAANSMAQGVSATTNYDNSYVWSGDDEAVHSANGAGTFNVYSKGGAAGFYVGGKTLDTMVLDAIKSNMAVLSADNQAFTGLNIFKKGITTNGITLSTNSTADFSNGTLTIHDQSVGTSDATAANTKFVTQSITSLSAATYSAISSATSALMTSSDVCSIVEQYLKAALGDSIIS